MIGQLLICFLISFFCGLLAQRLRGNILAGFICFGFSLQYSYSLAALLSSGRFEGNFGVSTYWVALASVLVLLLAALQVLSVSFAAIRMPAGPQIPNGRATLAFFSLSLVGLVLMAISGGFGAEDRLQARSGSGFMFIFGYAGLGLCLALAAGLLGHYRVRTVMVLCLPTLLFFVGAGHRSVALMVLLCPFVPLIAMVCRERQYAIPVGFGLALLGSNYVNLITGSVRSLWSQGRELSVEAVVARYDEIRSAQPIPLATSHLEMLAGYLETAKSSDLLTGTFQTVVASFLNFLPRVLFPEKADTSGVYFASIYFPDWFSYGYHQSSLTTGIFLDSVFNFGIPLAVVLIASLYAVVGLAIKRLLLGNGYHVVLGVYMCWLFGFNVFFDDLGGVVNKFVIGVIFYICACFLGGVARLSGVRAT